MQVDRKVIHERLNKCIVKKNLSDLQHKICSISTAENNGKKSKEKDTATKKIKPIKGKKPDHNQ